MLGRGRMEAKIDQRRRYWEMALAKLATKTINQTDCI